MRTHDFTRFHGRLTIRGELELHTPLRIGGGGGGDMGLADIAVVKDTLGRPYIPGSSFKGVLRSQVETLLRTIDPALACLCVTNQDDHTCPTVLRRSRQAGESASPYERRLAAFGGDEDALYLEGTCRACQVFGANGLAAKVIIPDMPLCPDQLREDGAWYGRYQIRHGVSIDRDTETAAEGRLYTGEAVPAGTRFTCAIVVENGSAADQGLVLLGLRFFEKGLVTLGGAASRGLGQIALHLTACDEAPGTPTGLIDFLVSGAATAVDEAGRLAKVNALRQELGV